MCVCMCTLMACLREPGSCSSCVCLSLSLCMSLCVSVSVSVSVSVRVCLSMCLSVCLSVCIWVSVYTYVTNPNSIMTKQQQKQNHKEQPQCTEDAGFLMSCVLENKNPTFSCIFNQGKKDFARTATIFYILTILDELSVRDTYACRSRLHALFKGNKRMPRILIESQLLTTCVLHF